jgi:hypothetical protein
MLLLTFLAVGVTCVLSAYHLPARVPPAVAVTDDQPPAKPGEATVELRGHVLTPDGRPAAGARLAVVTRLVSRFGDGVPRATAGPDGSFRLTVPQAELAQHLAVGQGTYLVATAKGMGLAWGPASAFLAKADREKVGVRAGGAEPTLRLVVDDVPLTGRVETAEGQPVAGARIELCDVWANDQNDLGPWLRAVQGNEPFSAVVTGRYLNHWLAGTGLARLATTTDAQGRFRFTGIGRGRLAALRVSGPTAALAHVVARTQPGARVEVNGLASMMGPRVQGCFGADLKLIVAPARPIVGVIHDLATGRPVAGARVQGLKFAGTNFLAFGSGLATRTNAQGRYRLDGMPPGGDNMILVLAAGKEPYLPRTAEVDTSQGQGPVTLNLKVRRGLWATGRVTDAATGRPVAADVDYYCLSSNPELARAPGFEATGQNMYPTDTDGNFKLPILPGHGVLAVRARGQDSHMFGWSWTNQGGKTYRLLREPVAALAIEPFSKARASSGYRTAPFLLFVNNYHHMLPINPAADSSSITCNVQLGSQPAAAVKGAQP